MCWYEWWQYYWYSRSTPMQASSYTYYCKAKTTTYTQNGSEVSRHIHQSFFFFLIIFLLFFLFFFFSIWRTCSRWTHCPGFRVSITEACIRNQKSSLRRYRWFACVCLQQWYCFQRNAYETCTKDPVSNQSSWRRIHRLTMHAMIAEERGGE